MLTAGAHESPRTGLKGETLRRLADAIQRLLDCSVSAGAQVSVLGGESGAYRIVIVGRIGVPDSSSETASRAASGAAPVLPS